jgi:Ser/Thr protein kinase RdoA (MazF antagonist)
MALLALEQHGDTGAWADAFRSGYQQVRPWPEADPDTAAALRAARHLNILNFSMSVGGPGVEAFVARHAAAIREWMAA